jgi:hypothetical protein
MGKRVGVLAHNSAAVSRALSWRRGPNFSLSLRGALSLRIVTDSGTISSARRGVEDLGAVRDETNR